MSESISRRVKGVRDQKAASNLEKLLDAVLADLTALRSTVAANVTDVAALAANVDTLAAKLNADGGVTDEDYDETNAAGVTASAPSALTTTE
jgi:hypothetical protein